jgi:hypothetical protein
MRWVLLSLALLAAACDRTRTIPANPAGPTAPAVLPFFNRADWPQWFDQDGDCQDARHEVLIEESLIPPALDARGCRVIAGHWRDEYTGAVYADPKDVEIDHRVSLANAHRSGGWIWDRSRKRDYANDLVDPQHLVAVGAETNRVKGDKGPDAWRPPLRENWCRYATTWRDIKRRWDLSITSDEERALRDMCS